MLKLLNFKDKTAKHQYWPIFFYHSGWQNFGNIIKTKKNANCVYLLLFQNNSS